MGREANASIPTNCCCLWRWPQARTRHKRRPPNHQLRANRSGGAGRTVVVACRRTCPANPGITNYPRPSASVRTAERSASTSAPTGASNSITGRHHCLSSSISFTNTSAPVAADGRRQPRNSQHSRSRSPSPCRCQNPNSSQRPRRSPNPRRDRQRPNQSDYPLARRPLIRANGRNRRPNRVDPWTLARW